VKGVEREEVVKQFDNDPRSKIILTSNCSEGVGRSFVIAEGVIYLTPYYNLKSTD
jgi:hypothetical protein